MRTISHHIAHPIAVSVCVATPFTHTATVAKAFTPLDSQHNRVNTHCHCLHGLHPSPLTTQSCQHTLPLSPWPPPISTHNKSVSTHAVLQPNAVNGKLAKNGGPRRKSATSKVQAGSRSRARSAAATHAAEHDPRDDRAVLLVECTVPSRVYFTFSAYVVLAHFSDTLVFAPEWVKGWQ